MHACRIQFTLAILALVGLTNVAAETPPPDNRVRFQVSASDKVDSDTLVVRMAVQHRARKQSQAANRVNSDMAWAIDLARAVPGIEAQTLEYHTNPAYEDRRIVAWNVRQVLRLESTDDKALTELLGQLQERLAIESVGYEISPPARAAAESALIARAITAFRERAAAIATAFGHGGFRMISADVSTDGARRPPIALRGRAIAMQAESADPVIESGQQAVTVRVAGEIELSDQ